MAVWTQELNNIGATKKCLCFQTLFVSVSPCLNCHAFWLLYPFSFILSACTVVTSLHIQTHVSSETKGIAAHDRLFNSVMV